MQALEAGAVDVILKPRIAAADHLNEIGERIRNVVKAAAQARLGAVRRGHSASVSVPEKKLTADAVLPPLSGRAMAKTTEKVVCIGASTGGTESLSQVLEALPANAPGIVVVQHMPEKFTAAFARRLNDLCQVEVKEAAHGDPVLSGHVLIAPGDQHTLLERQGARYQVLVRQGPLVSRHRPSVDVLFRSAARSAGANAVGIIMTGMGNDGARAGGDEGCRRAYRSAGRSHLHRVRYTQGGHRAEPPRRYSRSNASPARSCSPPRADDGRGKVNEVFRLVI